MIPAERGRWLGIVLKDGQILDSMILTQLDPIWELIPVEMNEDGSQRRRSNSSLEILTEVDESEDESRDDGDV